MLGDGQSLGCYMIDESQSRYWFMTDQSQSARSPTVVFPTAFNQNKVANLMLRKLKLAYEARQRVPVSQNITKSIEKTFLL